MNDVRLVEAVKNLTLSTIGKFFIGIVRLIILFLCFGLFVDGIDGMIGEYGQVLNEKFVVFLLLLFFLVLEIKLSIISRTFKLLFSTTE